MELNAQFWNRISRQHAPKFFQNHWKQIHAPTIKMVEIAFWQFGRRLLSSLFDAYEIRCVLQWDYDFLSSSFACLSARERTRALRRLGVLLTFKMSLHPKWRTYKKLNFLLKCEWRETTVYCFSTALRTNRIDLVTFGRCTQCRCWNFRISHTIGSRDAESFWIWKKLSNECRSRFFKFSWRKTYNWTP